MSASRSAWGLAATEALSETEGWRARIHIHKLLYLAGALLNIAHPFDFELYRFGPYSFDLDATIRDLELCGLLEKKQPLPGYGPSYSAADDWREAVDGEIPHESQTALGKIARVIGPKKGGELELLATCCWVEQHLGLTDDDSIVAEVKKIKTRASEDAIRQELQNLRSLRRQLET